MSIRYVLVLLSIAALLLMGYLALPDIIATQSTKWLLARGFTEVSFVPTLPGLSGVELHGVKFTYVVAGRTLRGQTSTLTLSYDLFGDNEDVLSEIEFSEATLHIAEPAAVAASVRQGQPSFSSAILKQTLSELPLGTLTANHLKINTDEFGDFEIDTLRAKKQEPLSIEGTYQKSGISYRGSLRVLATSGKLVSRGILSSAEKALLPLSMSADILDSQHIALTAEDLNFAALISLYSKDALKVTGTFNTQFTLNLAKGGVSIQDGKFRAAPPGGIIQYEPGDLSAASAPGLEIAFQALKNFHYSSLNGTVDLHSDGKLLLGFEITGQNPDWQAGRAVNFNLNVEENLYELIRTIRLTSDVEGELKSVIGQGN